MAKLFRLQPRAKVEDHSLFSSYTGNVYMNILVDETGTFSFWQLFCASPTESYFNALPVASEVIDTVTGDRHVKVGATTWKTVTQS